MIFRYYGRISFKIIDGGEVEVIYNSYTSRQDTIDYMFERYPIEHYNIRPYVYVYPTPVYPRDERGRIKSVTIKTN